MLQIELHHETGIGGFTPEDISAQDEFDAAAKGSLPNWKGAVHHINTDESVCVRVSAERISTSASQMMISSPSTSAPPENPSRLEYSSIIHAEVIRHLSLVPNLHTIPELKGNDYGKNSGKI
jgi:hypothetical protein